MKKKKRELKREKKTKTIHTQDRDNDVVIGTRPYLKQNGQSSQLQCEISALIRPDFGVTFLSLRNDLFSFE